jgi:hypothetical protein
MNKMQKEKKNILETNEDEEASHFCLFFLKDLLRKAFY